MVAAAMVIQARMAQAAAAVAALKWDRVALLVLVAALLLGQMEARKPAAMVAAVEVAVALEVMAGILGNRAPMVLLGLVWGQVQ